ncbi:MAG: STAS domain-containing protein [Clostridiales bacterium]|nr:STAS domain-containing protein [Clostridiales bacterium]
MTIEKNVQDGIEVLRLNGWLDTQSCPQLETEIGQIEENVSTLVLDCSGLEYISSGGLRLIVAAYKRMKGALTLRHVSDEIMGVIRMTGLDRRLNFE